MSTVNIYENAIKLYDAAALAWIEVAKSSIHQHNGFHIALAGGSTPKHLYNLMKEQKFRRKVEWEKVFVYFGDERSVPPDHEDSNYFMAKTALLDHVPIPESQIFRMPADDKETKQSANNYSDILNRHLPKNEQGKGQFDLILLGIGDDGHTASLFPDTQILQSGMEVDAVYVDKLSTWRMSITYLVINRAKHIFILCSGDGKADIIKEVLGNSTNQIKYPIQKIEAKDKITWFLDKAAAKKLEIKGD